MIDILLPWPPSTNCIFARGKGRGMFPSARYKAWKEEASHALRWQQMDALSGPVEVKIQLSSPTKRVYDLDNRVKPILDLLVDTRLIDGDDMQTVTKITVERGSGFTGAWVLVEPRQ